MPLSQRYLLLLLLGALLFLPALGAVHLFDWDEINFAECAREMIVTKDYLRMQIDFQPFWEKPPLFIWMQVLAMKIFGVNEYAARFPNALVGMSTLVSLYYVGRQAATERRALLWIGFYLASWLPHFYFKSGIIDPAFNLFIFGSVYQLYRLRTADKPAINILLGGLFLGLAVLTKGPVALLITALCFGVYFIWNRGLNGFKIGRLLLFALFTLLVSASWFAVEVAHHGWWFVREFVVYQAGLFSQNIASHEEPWFYHPIVLLIGCFPASLFLFRSKLASYNRQEPTQKDFTRWMWILFWVVLILFSLVKTKIVHYSSLCYFPITYLAARHLEAILEGQIPLKKWLKAALLFLGTVWGIVLLAIPLVGIYKDKLIPYIKDRFAVGNLSAQVPWSLWECTWGILYLVGIWWAVILFRRQTFKAVLVLGIVQVIAIQATILHFTPKIEAISQRAAIDFFKSKQGEDCYVQVLGYKSYAHLFYTQKLPPADKRSYDEQWLLHGAVQKPVYFVCKVDSDEEFTSNPDLEVIGRKNGFIFLKRR